MDSTHNTWQPQNDCWMNEERKEGKRDQLEQKDTHQFSRKKKLGVQLNFYSPSLINRATLLEIKSENTVCPDSILKKDPIIWLVHYSGAYFWPNPKVPIKSHKPHQQHGFSCH